jgi:hypothetical protein
MIQLTFGDEATKTPGHDDTLKAPKDSDRGTAPPLMPRRYESKREGAKESFLRLVQLLMEPGLGGRWV